ncbi:bifunctional Prefoldin beta-like/Prefoldin/Prefoldin subunit 2 [Babesia duncani]|uniref:Bifunctional Prefoldin beta-like/Prefoldin/Prefoldin subunit 2 n=1 Tax=Babesia duncani TaxID=323732 RepID=A0AAD9UQS8_9APIC|nr:bifunctional Prefoldin beta-like/Prefoldin/Prefoldin subunit 2 [Babesia duncani]
MSATDSKIEVLKTLEKERIRLLGQMDDVGQDAAEHRLVLKTLSELPKDRKCYRLIGGVAVERTVGEVLPALEAHANKVTIANEHLHADGRD